MIIDEIQRLPELLLSIKARVDTRPLPGQFLLTGSARVVGLHTLPDALPGRMETIELWPFAQGEIDGRPDRFIDAVFSHGPDLRHVSSLDRADYADRVVRGGFPEAVARDPPVEPRGDRRPGDSADHPRPRRRGRAGGRDRRTQRRQARPQWAHRRGRRASG